MQQAQKDRGAQGLLPSEKKALFAVLNDHYCGAYFSETIEGFVHNLNSPLQILWIRTEQVQNDLNQLQDAIQRTDRQELSEIALRIKTRADSLEKGLEDLNHRLSFLTRDIILKKRSEVGLVDINEVVKDTLFLLNADMFFKHRVKKEIQLKEQPMKVRGRYSDLCIVALHVIQNALEAMSQSEERSLVVSTYSEEETVVIRVQDSGIGIAPEIENDVFAPFFTTKATMEYNGQQQHHAGLGLSQVAHVLDAFGGSIAFESHPSKTVFTIKIPSR